jgi:hypothetical protein
VPRYNSLVTPQWDAGLLTSPTRLHPSSAYIQLFGYSTRRIGLLTSPTCLHLSSAYIQLFGYSTAGCRSPHLAHEPSSVQCLYTTLWLLHKQDRSPHLAHAPSSVYIQLFGYSTSRIGLLTSPTRLHPSSVYIQLFGYSTSRIGLLISPTRAFIRPVPIYNSLVTPQRDAGLLTAPTRLHPFQCLDIQLFGYYSTSRIGFLTSPSRRHLFQCLDTTHWLVFQKQDRSPHLVIAHSNVTVPKYNSLVTP